MGIENGDAGQLAGNVGSRASLVNGGRSELSSDSQPTSSLCFRNCSVSSRTEHRPSMPLLHHGFLSTIKVNVCTAAFTPAIVSTRCNKSLRSLTWTLLSANVISRIEMQLFSGLSGLVQVSSRGNLCLGHQPGAFSVCVGGTQCLLTYSALNKNKTISGPKKIALISAPLSCYRK